MPRLRQISNKITSLNIDNPHTEHRVEWINIVNAGKKEVDYLRKRFHFEMQQLRATMGHNVSQRPTLEVMADYLFLILHFPIIKNSEIKNGEIDFFVGHGFLITVHNNLPSLNDFFNTAKKDPSNLRVYKIESSAILLAEILDHLINSIYIVLDENSKTIELVDEIIFSQRQEQAVSILLRLRHNIINIRKLLQNHKNILYKLHSQKSSLVDAKEIKATYDRLVEHSKSIWEILENQNEMIDTLFKTNQSTINNNLNSIMKTLTIISVTVLPLTLMSSIFSMNFNYMPLIDNHYGFIWINIIMMVGFVAMLLWVKGKKWL